MDQRNEIKSYEKYLGKLEAEVELLWVSVYCCWEL